MPLNSYVSFNKPLYAGEPGRTLADVLSAARGSDPEEAFIGQESYNAIARVLLESLSPLERETLTLYLEGRSYAEIAERLGRRTKTIDNALQRVKQKLEQKLK
jgi:RNA polymerase sporulation-specific sigma factor